MPANVLEENSRQMDQHKKRLVFRTLTVESAMDPLSVRVRNGMVWYTRVQRLTRHSIGHFGDGGRGGLSSDVHLPFSNGGPAT